ncbi:MAG: protease HtpX [Thermoleophilia bacterium]
MSVTQASLTTRIRTWLLLAALSALLVGIGALIGGGALYGFIVMAVVMNLVAYWFSDKFALMASRAKPIEESQAPELYAMVRELAERFQVPMPRVYLIPSEQPNAFATGRNPGHAVVAVTEGLLRYLPADQVRGVLAHELAHVRNRDILVASIAAMIAGAISMLQYLLFFGVSSRDRDESPLGAIGAIAALVIGPIAATLLQLAVSRQREYLADATAARVLGEGKPLADALETLERGRQALPMEVNPATASLYIVNPLRGGGLASLFSTHPPIAERVRRLRAYDAARGLHYG